MIGFLKRRKARKEAQAKAARDQAILRREASDRSMTRVVSDPRVPSGASASQSDDSAQSYGLGLAGLGAGAWAFDPSPSYASDFGSSSDSSSSSSDFSGGGGDFGGGGSDGSW